MAMRFLAPGGVPFLNSLDLREVTLSIRKPDDPGEQVKDAAPRSAESQLA